MVSDRVVTLKKNLYTDLNLALKSTNRTVHELFRKIDSDHSQKIGVDEVYKLFMDMKTEGMDHKLAQEIFDSIDFDGSGQISLPEFISDFNTILDKDL